MLFQSSGKGVSVRIEVSGGDFDGELGDCRKRALQAIVMFALAIGVSKQVQLGILANELANALDCCLERLNRIHGKKENKFLGYSVEENENPFEGRGSEGSEEEGEGWPED